MRRYPEDVKAGDKLATASESAITFRLPPVVTVKALQKSSADPYRFYLIEGDGAPYHYNWFSGFVDDLENGR